MVGSGRASRSRCRQHIGVSSAGSDQGVQGEQGDPESGALGALVTAAEADRAAEGTPEGGAGPAWEAKLAA